MRISLFILVVFCLISYTEVFSFEIYGDGYSFYEKPKRSKFVRKRLGSNTFLGEAGYFYGHYKGERYSFNYDAIVEAQETNAFSIRIGIGYSKATNDSTVKGQEIFIPVSVHLILGRKNHFDLGLGGYYFENRQTLTPFLFIGFRHQNPKGGFTYRFGADIHMERVFDLMGRNLQKTAVYGPLVAIGWSF